LGAVLTVDKTQIGTVATKIERACGSKSQVLVLDVRLSLSSMLAHLWGVR
jgi:hypothetical protein